ncbi:ligand-binding sensor domain-containing protein [Sphingobacterium composti Ten et al. 2007 non Yoo et al. 2007]|uniref:ligand-binding sensor domain-containing protein n=1 Tax=Sphingobacterium composti TaxID=363260 RepID=UPI001F1A75B5|nr:sensor histidine kinase [Sphingobacterium composti Ten et al. 2007 non Yoo et al. 2007]
MYKIGLWLLILFSLILPKQQYAQPYYFNHYQITDGLSNNTVICSMQDSYGFLWFGTKDGLDRFDGNNFKHFDIRNQVLNTVANNIISLIEDNQKQIWIGTDQGIYIYNPLYETFSLLDEEFAYADIPVIKKDSKNNMWFIANQSLYFYDYTKKRTTKINADQNNISAILCTDDDKLYYGTFTGKICQLEQFRSKTIINLERTYGPKDWFAIQKIIENERGNLIFGTSKAGVGSISKDETSVKWLLGLDHLKQFLYVRDILQINDQEYWFATESGLFIYNIESKQYINIKKAENNPWGISDNAIYNILKDKDGGIWLGTYFGGINYYHKNNSLIEKFMSKTQGGKLLGTVVRVINKDKNGMIWLGTENGGLSKLHPTSGKIENFSVETVGLSDNNTHGLLTHDDNIILGTFVYGMDIFNSTSKKVIYHAEYDGNSSSSLKSNFLYDIKKSRSGEILLATTRGHYSFDITNKSFHPIHHVPFRMSYTTLFEDRNGYVWLGTWRSGLYMYHPTKNIQKHFSHNSDDSNSLPNNKINFIFEDSKGHIWIATEGGLSKLINKNGEFEFIKPNISLPSKIVFAILEDQSNNLWITTSKGLTRYNPATNSTRLFNMESGLPSIQFNYNSAFDDGEGHFYFGTINGMIRFEPKKLNQIKYNANTPIYITKLTVNNKEINQHDPDSILTQSILFTDEIILKYDQSSFSLDFTALLFDSPHSIKYSYKLDGVNKDWVTTNGSTSAHFTKLLPGNYDFIVKAEDPNGFGFTSERKLRIKILPPIWASIPAFILYFSMLIGLILFVAYHFNERIKQKNKEHLLTIQNLREQELYQSKINFYTDVVHEIRTPLTLIKAPLEKLVTKIPYNPITDKLLQNIQNNTERLIALSNQLLDFRKVETKGFKFNFELKNISISTQALIDNYKLTLEAQQKTLITDIDPNISCFIDLEAYEIICNNLLNNALKYSKNIVVVELHSDTDNKNLIFTVKNDGIIIKEKDQEFIFEPFNRLTHSKSIPGSGLGLSLAQSLAIKLNGQINYSIDKENLNTFTLRLPINQNYVYEC